MAATPNGTPTLLTQGAGIQPYVLGHLAAGLETDPSMKITPAGFLKAAIETTGNFGLPDHEKLRLTSSDGHYQNVKLWYYTRGAASEVTSSLDCIAGNLNDRQTIDLSAVHVASATIQFSNTDLMQYAEEATQTVLVGGAPTPFMADVLKQITTKCNAIAQKINADIAADLVFGKNVVSGYSGTTPTVVNINEDATKFNLSEGVQKIITDAQLNEFGDVAIVGAGKMLSYQNLKKAITNGFNGINQADVDGYEYYRDYTAPGLSAWGANADNLAVIDKSSIGFVDLNNMVGFRKLNLGTYQSFQIALPIYNYAGEMTMMNFDVKMRFNACPTDVADAGYNGGAVRTIGEGWSIQISKQYGLFQLPTTLYPTGDRLNGNNGVLLYNLTNVAD